MNWLVRLWRRLTCAPSCRRRKDTGKVRDEAVRENLHRAYASHDEAVQAFTVAARKTIHGAR